MKLLLTGFNCSPVRGSEYSFTWRWAWHLSRQHEVWVLMSPFWWDEVLPKAERETNLHFEKVEGQAGFDVHRHPWQSAPNYLVWQRRMFRRASELHQRIRFDIIHHVSWGSVSAPPLLWKLPAPFVWGPVGGGQSSPSGLDTYFGKDRWKEWVRRQRLRMLPHRGALRQAAQRSKLILVTNRETEEVLRKCGASSTMPFLDSGIPPEQIPHEPFRRASTEHINVLWAGKLEPRKALPLALEALRRVKTRHLSLLVAGQGPKLEEWRRLAAELQLSDRVRFLGQVAWERMFELYRQSDIFLFTSLRDSFGMQVLEACSQALPVVTLNHQGVGMFVPAGAGIKVAVSTPDDTAQGLAEAINLLAASPDLRSRMGAVGWKFARSEAWDFRAQRMSVVYEQLVAPALRPVRRDAGKTPANWN